MKILKCIPSRRRLLFVMILLCLGIPATISQAQGTPPPRDSESVRSLYQGNREAIQESYRGEINSAQPQEITDGVPVSWSRLAYESFMNNNWDVYLAKPFGNPVRLTTSATVDAEPDLMRGGQRVVYVSKRTGNYEIFSSSDAGENLTQLTNNPATDSSPAWSPDGSTLAFQSYRTGNAEVFTMNADGSNVAQLTFSSSFDGQPAWSPDGSQIVFVSSRSGNYELWIMDANGANQHKITTGAYAMTPAWSPDGSQIAYGSDYDGDSFYEVFLVNPDGSSPQLILNIDVYNDVWAPAWSPDGNYLAYIETHWIYYQNHWYWTESNLKYYELSTKSQGILISDDRIWSVSWATTDVQAPDACIVSVDNEQYWESFVVGFSAQDLGSSGVDLYDVQARLSGAASWQTINSYPSESKTLFFGPNAGVVEFRCRARDAAGNWANWDYAPIVATLVDNAPPVSQIEVADAFVRDTGSVLWTGADAGKGIAGYDIWYRDGVQSDWALWLDDVTQTSELFSGQLGHTYFFRSQATDLMGHTEPWRPDPQASITFYANLLMVDATDPRGQPVGQTSIDLTPSEIISSTDSLTEKALFYLSEAPTHTLSIAAHGFGELPSTVISTTMDMTIHPVLPPKINLIQNGDFEIGTLNGWELNGGSAEVISDTQHTGQYAILLSNSGVTTTRITQSVEIGPQAHQPTLSFMVQIPTDLENGNFQVFLSEPITRTILISDTATDGWQHVWTDLSDDINQAVTITFQLSDTLGAVLVDDISIGNWETPIVELVSPTSWMVNQTPTVVISGENFIPTPQIFLGDMSLVNVTWVSSTLLTVEMPPGLTRGTYPLLVVNPDGSFSALAVDVNVNEYVSYLPSVQKNKSLSFSTSSAPADWPTIGANVAHTGYNPSEPGASRYSLVWQSNLSYGDPYGFENITVVDHYLAVASGGSNTSGGVVAVFDAATGQEIWQQEFPDVYSLNPASIAHGNLYFAVNDYDTQLYSLSLRTGKENWKSNLISQWNTYLAPLVVEDLIYQVFGYGNNAIAGYDVATGTRRWANSVPNTIYDNWIPAHANGSIYSWVRRGFTKFDDETGEEQWSIPVGDYLPHYDMDTLPVIARETALLTSPLGLYAVDLATHEVRWSNNASYQDTFPAVAGETVYAFQENVLEERSLSDGTLLWSYVGEDHWLRAPVITPNYLYVSNLSGKTFGFDRNSHQIIWETDQAGWLVVANGFLYIIEYDETILAFRAQEP